MTFLTFMRDNARWLGAGMLLSFLSSFGQTFFIAIFAGEIRETFGLSHGEWGSIYTFGTGASALLMLYAGGLSDRFRVRAIGLFVLGGLALSCFAMALNRSAFLLPVVIFALRFFGQGMSSHISLVAMARWFVATRGRALAVATLGFTLGEATLPLSFAALKQLVDWHVLWILAGLVALASIPVLLGLLREERTPQSVSAETNAPGLDHRHWTRAEALRQPAFLSTLPALLSFPALGTAFWFHQVHFAAVKGWEHLSLVAVFPLGTAMFFASTVLFGVAIDRFGSTSLMPLYLVPLAAGFLILSVATSIHHAALGVMLMGLAGGGQATLPSACWAEFFGTRHVGAIKSVVAAIMVLGSALGPGITGVLIDRGITMPAQLQGYAAIIAAASLVMVIPMARARPRLARTAQIDI